MSLTFLPFSLSRFLFIATTLGVRTKFIFLTLTYTQRTKIEYIEYDVTKKTTMLSRGINARILSGIAFRIEDLATATWSRAVSSVTTLTSLPSETFCGVRYAQLPPDDSFIRAYATARVDGVSSPTAIPFSRWTSQTTMHGSDTSPQGATECWKCASILDTSHDAFFCPNCGAIQAIPKGSTTFSLLGLNPTFEIDLDNLEATFKGLQRRLHPDRFTTSSSKERELSAEASAMVNKAYDILRHPLKRAKCLVGREICHQICIFIAAWS